VILLSKLPVIMNIQKIANCFVLKISLEDLQCHFACETPQKNLENFFKIMLPIVGSRIVGGSLSGGQEEGHDCI
jgi:hypothetical protein